jgi:hypothetical protein
MRDGYGGEIGHSDARSCILSCPIVAKSVKDPGKNGGGRRIAAARIEERNSMTTVINHNGWDITS